MYSSLVYSSRCIVRSLLILGIGVEKLEQAGFYIIYNIVSYCIVYSLLILRIEIEKWEQAGFYIIYNIVSWDSFKEFEPRLKFKQIMLIPPKITSNFSRLRSALN